MEIKNKVIVITGGTRGLGKALMTSFVTRDNKVVISARSIKRTSFDKEKQILTVKADVTKESDMQRLSNLTINKFGRIDIWINNAGIWLPHATIERMNIKRVHEMVEVNLFGTIYGSKYALIQMRKQKNGFIVNILSSSSLDGGAGSSGYCASKFAASGFTKSLRLEAKSDRIKAISVYSRGMKTNLFDEKKPENYDKFMDPVYVSEKIIANLEAGDPQQDLMIMN